MGWKSLQAFIATLSLGTTTSNTSATSAVPATCSQPYPPNPEPMNSVFKSWQWSDCNATGCRATKVLKIGTAITLDYGTKYGVISLAVQRAYTLYFNWLNKKRGGVNISGEIHWVQLVLLDDRSRQDRVTNITKYLTEQQHIRHLLAPYSSELSERAAKVANESGAVMVAPCAAATSVFKDRPRVFGMLPTAPKFLESALDKLQWFAHTVGYVYEDKPFSVGACRAANVLAAKLNMKVLFGSTTVGFEEGKLIDDANQSQVDDVVMQMSSRKPDLFIGCVYDNVCRRILKSLEKQRFNPKAIILTICVAKDDFRSIVGDSAGYILGVTPWTRELKLVSDLTNLTSGEFYKMFVDTYAISPPYQAAAAFAAAATLVHGLETAGATDPDKVANVLRNMGNASIFGTISFDANGQTNTPIKVVQVQGVSSPVVSPKAAATAELKYPKPTFDSMPCQNQDKFNIGRHGIFANGSCLNCSSIEVSPFNQTLGYRVCQKLVCKPGRRSVIFEEQESVKAGAYCAGCFRGFYAAEAGHTQCDACAVGKFQDQVASTGCALCVPGRYSPQKGAMSCLDCPAGHYAAEFGSSVCTQCPVGSKCVGNNSLYTNYTNIDGWYLLRHDDGRRDLVRCQHGKDGSACVEGGRCHMDKSTGEPAMEGHFCGKCRPNYGRSEPRGLCKACPSQTVLVLLGLLNVGLIVGVSFAIYVLVLWTDLSKPKNITAVILKQMLNYIGMSTVVMNSTTLRFPFDVGFLNHLAHFCRVLFGASSPAFASHAGECFAAQFMPAYKFYAIVGLTWVPVWVVLLCLLFWLFWGFRKCEGKHYMRRSRLMTVLIVNLFVVHPRNTELCLSVFNCGHFDKPRLMMDTTVDCESASHATWQILGLTGFALYSLGIPFGVFVLLRYYKSIDKLHKKKTVDTLGFLYSGFEPQYYYFEAVFMIRKVLYQLIILIPPLAASADLDDRLIKCVSMLMLAVFFLAVHMKFEPYDNRSYFTLDRIEGASLWAILVTLLVQSWLYVSDDAYAFNVSENGDAGVTLRNKDIRDTICITIVAYFHARFFVLVVFLMFRPFLLSVTRWQMLDHGFVEIRPDGFCLTNADSIGRKLFTSMFEELTALLIDARQAITYDELLASLQFMCVNSTYHKKADRIHLGFEDEEEYEDTYESHFSFRQSVKADNLKSMVARASHIVDKKVVKHVKHVAENINTVAHHALDGEVAEHRHKVRNTLREHKKRKLQELEHLKQFNAHSVRLCIGEKFSIEELHMSMVRLNKDIGRGDALTLEGKLRSKPHAHMFSYGAHISTDNDSNSADDTDEERAPGDPPELHKHHSIELELRRCQVELAKLHAEHQRTLEDHNLFIETNDARRKDLLQQIKDQMKLRNNELDEADDVDAQETGDECVVGMASASELPHDAEESEDVEDEVAIVQKRISGIPSTSSDQCENCGNILMIDSLFCRHCAAATPRSGGSRLTPRQGSGLKDPPASCLGLHRPPLHQEAGVQEPPDDVQADVRAEMEDRICRLNLELEVAKNTIQAQAESLRETENSVVALQGQLKALHAAPASSSLFALARRPRQPPTTLAEGLQFTM